VNSLPASIPAIDFDAYRAKVTHDLMTSLITFHDSSLMTSWPPQITVPGMVDNFAAKYAALDIPYPGDQGALAAIDAQAAEQKAKVAEFCAASNKRIEGIKVQCRAGQCSAVQCVTRLSWPTGRQ
jgi:hypothetical protein